MTIEQLNEFFTLLESTRDAIQSVTCDEATTLGILPIVENYTVKVLEIMQQGKKQ